MGVNIHSQVAENLNLLVLFRNPYIGDTRVLNRVGKRHVDSGAGGGKELSCGSIHHILSQCQAIDAISQR